MTQQVLPPLAVFGLSARTVTGMARCNCPYILETATGDVDARRHDVVAVSAQGAFLGQVRTQKQLAQLEAEGPVMLVTVDEQLAAELELSKASAHEPMPSALRAAILAENTQAVPSRQSNPSKLYENLAATADLSKAERTGLFDGLPIEKFRQVYGVTYPRFSPRLLPAPRVPQDPGANWQAS